MNSESSNLLQMLSSSPAQSPTFPFFGVSALILIYVVILYLVIDFNCPAYGITTTSSSTTTEDLRSGMSLEEIKDLPCFDIRVNIASICVVCLDDVHRGDRCRRFPSCNHVFHAQCIDPWLVRRLTCPTCRSPFKTNVNLDVYLDAV
ncbi:hypothetical protein LWI28_017010 [Acer negundo]|uniref:RING-type E3 ubiquitin transferase n=1 Tax=Acer negundo TaxID=4023 RepID=A0AAD5P606_ACENE|nr:hypothetical protein LWI28_017010 [Acer negundo]